MPRSTPATSTFDYGSVTSEESDVERAEKQIVMKIHVSYTECTYTTLGVIRRMRDGVLVPPYGELTGMLLGCVVPPSM
jgi:hypothetical protein